MGECYQKIILAYFSGTGCTKAVCDCFAEQLLELGVVVIKIDIATGRQLEEQADLLVIFSPVYAFRLASITETWVSNLPSDTNANTSAAIISVSGGGETSPNTACRAKCKRILSRKGYNMVYEKMIVMPSNFAIQAEQSINYALLNVMPAKVKYIIQDILAGRKRVTTPKIQDRIFAVLGKAEQFGARMFGAFIRASQRCTKCGLCISNCPQNNIRMANGLPRFGYNCILCLKCIYSCPNKALSPQLMKSSILKGGFNLEKMSERAKMESNGVTEYDRYKNVLWQGVIEYLHEDDHSI